MASKREKLEARAEELGLSFVPETSDEDLQELINDFQNDNSDSEAVESGEDDREFTPDTAFFRSTIPGLSIQFGDEPERDEQPQEVRFVSYEQFDAARGEHYRVGYLATDEADAIEVLQEDLNVTEIDEADYRAATNPNDPKVKQVN